ncbi:MAG: thioredoxin [Rhodothermia bacterium]|nr:thioredoxin [Rhodothermia bacterium]
MAQDAKYVTLTDQNFQEEVLNSGEPVLVDFWAAWCGPCRIIAPVIEELAGEFEGRAKIAKMDVDENPQIPMNLGIRSIPTLLFFKDGKVVDQLVGAAPKKMLSEKLDNLVGQAA